MLRMGQFVLLGLALTLLGAVALAYRAGGRFESRKQRATIKELDREVASLHADFISHIRSDAGKAGVAAKKEKAAGMEPQGGPAGDPGTFFARQAMTDPDGARRGVLEYFRARDDGGR